MPGQTIGLVGLGNMGVPMARNLAAAGFALVVRDLDPARQERLADELGCAAAGEPADFAGAGVVVTMLPTGADVRDVVLEWGLAGALADRAVVVDMSSSDPIGTRELGAAISPRLALVDAPVSGGVPASVASFRAAAQALAEHDATE